jgi:Leucine-rich repeat (LRR) protein
LSWSNVETGGYLSTQIGKLTSLTRLTLTRMKLSGTIPPHIFGLTNLKELTLYHNSFSGKKECSKLFLTRKNNAQKVVRNEILI